MFLARTLRDGSTVYLNRRTGVRFVIAPQRVGVSLYADGRFLVSAQTRGEIVQHMEAIAN